MRVRGPKGPRATNFGLIEPKPEIAVSSLGSGFRVSNSFSIIPYTPLNNPNMYPTLI